MKILIDTQVLLWALMSPERLGTMGQKLIGNPENTLFLSAVSLWEIRIKESIGKLSLPRKFSEDVRKLGCEELAMTVAHTEALKDLPLLHRDPFDRMLVAQAKCEGLKLLTADRLLEGYGSWVIPIQGL
jgi:PIN domain nuclease of toxin-antitoxin system